jgi:hypothetical protein
VGVVKERKLTTTLQQRRKYIDLLFPNKLHTLKCSYAGQTRALLRISKFHLKSRLPRRLPSTRFAKDVPPPFGFQSRVYKEPHTREGGTASSLLCGYSRGLYTSLRTINCIIILGDIRTAWDAVAESEVHFQVINLKKY